MPKDALISAFFTKGTPSKPAERSSTQPSSTSPKVNASIRRREDSEEIVEEGRAAKQPRIETTSRPQASSSKSLDQWRFDQNAAVSHHNDGTVDLSQSQRTAEQEARHAAFTRRLLVSIERKDKREQEKKEAAASSVEKQDSNQIDDDDEVEEGESSNKIAEFAAAAPNGKGRATKEAAPTDGIKYTPLEKQYFELRKQYPLVMLCIEVGYKYKFYGEDARVASRELNIACFMEKHLMTAMVPVHRLQFHIKKLVLQGHKVGVVRQQETRALKAASSNASKPFTRALTELYTASTWVDDMLESNSDGSNASLPRSLVAIVEKGEGGTTGAEEKVSIGLIAVQASTGTITYDQFNDTSMRTELETRLAHLEPAEIILPSKVSKQTSRLIRYIAGRSSHSPTAVRIETTEKAPSYNEAHSYVGEFYTKAAQIRDHDSDAIDSSKILSVVVGLPPLALIALQVAIEHMSAFHLESVFRLATNFTSFASRHEMLLTGNTLSNLEILENNTDFREKGSLMWMLSGSCATTMGKRLLRRWLTRPLTDMDKLRDRSNAVESLLNERHVAAKTSSLLKGLPDLEKGLARLLYQRAAPTEVATIFLSLNRVTTEFEEGQYPQSLGSTLLDEAIATLPKARSVVQEALAAISLTHARDNNKRDLFVDPDKYEYVQDTKDLISVVDCDMHEHLLELRKIVKNPRLQYTTVALEEYLIEVAKDTRLAIPANWLRISSTTKWTRYRSPQVISLMKQRAQLQETLDAQADKAYRSFLSEICDQHYSLLRDVVRSLSTLDALISLSVLASLPGYTKAAFVQDGHCIDLKGFRHPMSEALMETIYVENDIHVGDDSPDGARGVLLTGSNMGGKSSTVRAISLVVIMAQIGSYVPATYARLSLHDAILTRIGGSDQIAKGRSTFMVEVQETAEIIRTATSKSLVFLDELGRGTSTWDGKAIAESVLQHLLEREEHRRPILFFVTHFLSLGRLIKTLPLRGMHMAYIDRGDNDISFLYKIRKGLAEKSFGIHCARLAHLPSTLLELARIKAMELEEQTIT
jgi:DNA mismatch repair protein MSH3